MSRVVPVPSKSKPGESYNVVEDDAGQFSCHDARTGEMCLGWKYSKKNPRTCSHIDKVRDYDERGAVPKALSNIPIMPMLASKPKGDAWITDFSKEDHVLEEKYNGHRLIIENGDELR